MIYAPGHIDFAEAWRTWIDGAADPCLEPAVDLAYWERVADEHDRGAQPHEHVLATIAAKVRPGETLLDIGAGTGRFALPLASRCAWVTALDPSPRMLHVLAGKADAAGIGNVTTVCGAWDAVSIDIHDVVLSAWSLYRERNLEACLAKMARATRRQLIIVVPDADASQVARGETAAYLYVLGALRDLGLRAELSFVSEPQPECDAVATPVISWERPHAGNGGRYV